MDGVSTARLDPETDERFLTLRRPLGATAVGLNQMTLHPGQRGRIHRHREQEEIYVVLRGVLTLVTEDGELEAGEGELVRVAAPVRRQLVNRGARAVVLLAIGATGDHAGRDGEAFADWTETVPRPPQEVPLPDDVPHA
jgi:uncharacterized cupin superfamily protein